MKLSSFEKNIKPLKAGTASFPWLLSSCLFSLSSFSSAYAQSIPGPADAGRVQTPTFEMQKLEKPSSIKMPETVKGSPAPEGAEAITFELREVKLEGVTAFKEEELSDIYKPYINKTISLSKVWEFAQQLTERYRAKRYFLSRAYVPAQEIDGGKIVIRVVEGHAGRIEWEQPLPESRIIRELTEELLAQKPLTTNVLESYLLRVNDLPGQAFRAVVQPFDETDKNAPEGAISIHMVPVEKKGQGEVRADNAGSRFLGPHQAYASYEGSFLPMQQTLLATSLSLPADELKYGSIVHKIPIFPEWNLELSGNYVRANPGYTLELVDIESKSGELAMAVTYQPIRQWLENMTLGLKVTGKDTDSDILGVPLTRDRVRAARLNFSYDRADILNGYSFWNATLSRGLKAFGANDASDSNISRAGAEPDFTKFEFSYTRQQPMTNHFTWIGRVNSQIADGSLYSSEEFGYGGQGFGRAYDPSEITGDDGVVASAELRFNSLPNFENLNVIPFAFYDIGRVWNDGAGGGDASGSSAGGGFITRFPSGISATFTAAQPLTRDIDNPIYGGGHKAPRFIFDLSYKF